MRLLTSTLLMFHMSDPLPISVSPDCFTVMQMMHMNSLRILESGEKIPGSWQQTCVHTSLWPQWSQAPGEDEASTPQAESWLSFSLHQHRGVRAGKGLFSWPKIERKCE